MDFSLGLPEDITMEELKEFFGKAGVLRFDSKSGDFMLKFINFCIFSLYKSIIFNNGHFL